MGRIQLVFRSVFDVLRAERICLESGRKIQVVPVPREISPECGLSLEMDDFQREQLLFELKQAGIEARALELRRPGEFP